MRAYKILARSELTYGNEAWTICKRDENRITATGMKFMRQTAWYTRVDGGIKTDTEELNTEPDKNFIQTYRTNRKSYVLRMPRLISPLQMLPYQPKWKIHRDKLQAVDWDRNGRVGPINERPMMMMTYLKLHFVLFLKYVTNISSIVGLCILTSLTVFI